VTVEVGRAGTCALAFPDDPEMSRRHIQLRRVAGAWQLTDLGSSAGTYIRSHGKDERVTRPTFLGNDDRIVIGQTVLRYLDPSVAGEEPTRPPTRLVGRNDVSALRRRILAELLRPELEGQGGLATNREIAEATSRSPDAIKKHLEALYEDFCLQDEPQGKKRMLLARRARDWGIVEAEDLDSAA
jgi:predicted component of type VI protein secretion system